MAGKTYKQLTQDDADFFLAHGYVVVKEAFSKTQADAFTRDLWVRLGLDPHDPSTWDRERIHMPSHTRVPVAQFAPKKVWCISGSAKGVVTSVTARDLGGLGH